MVCVLLVLIAMAQLMFEHPALLALLLLQLTLQAAVLPEVAADLVTPAANVVLLCAAVHLLMASALAVGSCEIWMMLEFAVALGLLALHGPCLCLTVCVMLFLPHLTNINCSQ